MKQRQAVAQRSRWARRQWGIPTTGRSAGPVRPGGPDEGGESGQTLVLFALLTGVLVAMLALVVDIGVHLGQRRFAQNGADAAALAAGRLLLPQASPLDLTVYREVRRYAGLNPTDLVSAVPTGVNQHPGLLGRTRLVATLEYDNGDGWCVSPSGPLPSGTPAPPVCSSAPPPFRSGRSYRVRVSASATTDGFFARAIGLGDLGSAACVRPAGARGLTTCAQAVVTIHDGGSGEYTIFTTDSSCSSYGVDVSGKDHAISGGVHSSNRVDISGNSNQVGSWITTGCANGLNLKGNNNKPTTSTVATPDKPTYPVDSLPCTWYRGGNVSLLGTGPWYANTLPAAARGAFDVDRDGPWWEGGRSSSNRLREGVYCAYGDIDIPSSGIRGQSGGPARVTFVAYGGGGDVSGKDSAFRPFLNNVFLAAYGTAPGGSALVKVRGNNLDWGGIIYAPNGEVHRSGSENQVINGAIVARGVKISGNGFSLDGTGQGVGTGERTATLTE